MPKWINAPQCSKCGKTYQKPLLWCTKCDNLNVISAIRGASRNQFTPNQFWDFACFFPKFEPQISLHEGFTPVIEIKNTQDLEGLKLKLEFRNPTGSFRDRAAALILSDVKTEKNTHITVVSTGSFSISIAAYAARAHVSALNFVPKSIELSKIEQMKLYSSNVYPKGNTLEQAIKYHNEFIHSNLGTSSPLDIYYPPPHQNILTIEGQKTIGLEIALNYPDIQNLLIPKGSGSLVYSIYRGLQDAIASGWISKMPHLYAIGLKKTANSQLAESLDIRDDRLVSVVSHVVDETGGDELVITANKMTEEALNIAKEEGIFIEPASASVLAAARKLQADKSIDLSKTMAILTGSGINAMNLFASQLRDVKKVVWGLSSASTKKFEILRVIAEGKAHHGYGIWAVLGKKKSIQSIYQHLNQLEEEGLVQKAELKGNKANYHLTQRGLETFSKMKEILALRE